MSSLASEDYNQDYLYDQMDLHTDKDELLITLPKGKLSITFSRIGEETIITRVHHDSQLKKSTYGITSSNHTFYLKNDAIYHSSVNTLIIKIKDIKLKGQHNLLNFLAAASCADICGIKIESISSKHDDAILFSRLVLGYINTDFCNFLD